MPECQTFITHEIAHDGWSFVVEQYEETLTRLVYTELRDGKVERRGAIEGICPESAREIAKALVTIAESIDGKKQEHAANNAEFQKGFYAGLAYSGWGDEATDAAVAAVNKIPR
ncbi:hypothetical protein [Rosistilla oblonga]|uniref:hypothetical protein n=1 Tax=Rosistilla oblonga TaxID=2527990 RepID=UPI003A97E4E7